MAPLLRSSWLKLASRGDIGHRRRAGVNGFFENRARPLCGTLMPYRELGPQPSSLSGECTEEAVVLTIGKNSVKYQLGAHHAGTTLIEADG